MKFAFGFAGVATLILVAGVSRADITTVTHMSMDMPGMHNGPQMPAAAQAQLDSMSNTTTYMSGHKVRTDSSFMSFIVNPDAGKMWFLNNTAHTYTVTPFDAAQSKQMMQSILKGRAVDMNAANYKVTDTGRTTKILGHTARHYIVKMSMTLMGQATTMTQDILAAQDLSAADTGAFGGGSGPGQVHGLPLVTTTTYHSGLTEGMISKQVVTSLTTTPIPASTFDLPDGYTLTENKDTTSGMFGK
ncbi:hypothetical protein CCAX7_009630 [Capsulimonas corticalis]|uniref:Uncharacterized protein n=1 Tax=Capsulimonas corticalis TaxID=2219043 RepID=A0A402CUB1_9BACT|nr:DUF4412 domain-containing protein [Capsulimonas corticalis]BDI28912.1 hypothetical protein CCAX7_009630 [Capsulimonas corticalis]